MKKLIKTILCRMNFGFIILLFFKKTKKLNFNVSYIDHIASVANIIGDISYNYALC